MQESQSCVGHKLCYLHSNLHTGMHAMPALAGKRSPMKGFRQTILGMVFCIVKRNREGEYSGYTEGKAGNYWVNSLEKVNKHSLASAPVPITKSQWRRQYT